MEKHHIFNKNVNKSFITKWNTMRSSWRESIDLVIDRSVLKPKSLKWEYHWILKFHHLREIENRLWILRKICGFAIHCDKLSPYVNYLIWHSIVFICNPDNQPHCTDIGHHHFLQQHYPFNKYTLTHLSEIYIECSQQCRL